jgi:hypothetical protein
MTYFCCFCSKNWRFFDFKGTFVQRLSKKVKFIEKLILKGVVAIHELPLQLLVIFMDMR